MLLLLCWCLHTSVSTAAKAQWTRPQRENNRADWGFKPISNFPPPTCRNAARNNGGFLRLVMEVRESWSTSLHWSCDLHWTRLEWTAADTPSDWVSNYSKTSLTASLTTSPTAGPTTSLTTTLTMTSTSSLTTSPKTSSTARPPTSLTTGIV